MKKKRGFTLIELVAVIAIIGILALMIVPKVDGVMKNSKTARMLSDLQGIVQAVELYNLNASDTEMITGITELSVIKNKLMTSGTEYLNVWPELSLKDEDGKFSKAADTTKYSKILEVYKANVNEEK